MLKNYLTQDILPDLFTPVCRLQILDIDFDLETLLESSREGRDVRLAYSTLLNRFTDENRSQLADILISHELNKRDCKGLSKKRIEELVSKIIDTFPTENKADWIYTLKSQGKTLVNGKFIRRYNTWKMVTNCSPIEGNSNCVFTQEIDGGDNAVVEVSFSFLKNASSPWHVVEELWLRTMSCRHEALRKFTDVYDYFKTFPCLREPLGFTLLEKDFQYLFPEAHFNLFAEWPKFSKFIEDILKEKDKNFLCGVTSTETRMMKLLMHISQIFPVVTVMNKSDVGSWRPSKAESQASFFLVLKSVQELQPILQKRFEKLAKYGLNLQPVPVIIGSAEKVLQCFIIFDTATYEVDNPLKALDLTFKMLQALHMQYPPECEQIWMFLQQAVYGIRNNRGKILPGTRKLISDYKKKYLGLKNSLELKD